MSDADAPRFRIHRFDTPSGLEGPASDSHYRAFWQIEGRTYRVHVYSKDEWENLPRPPHASGVRRLGGRGWMVLRPIDDR